MLPIETRLHSFILSVFYLPWQFFSR
jgi:hypothetical protein